MSEHALPAFEALGGRRHRHGDLFHEHPFEGPHDHHDHGHSHGLVHDSIKRSREGLKAVGLSLAILGLTAVAQTLIFVLSGSIALLADLRAWKTELPLPERALVSAITLPLELIYRRRGARGSGPTAVATLAGAR